MPNPEKPGKGIPNQTLNPNTAFTVPTQPSQNPASAGSARQRRNQPLYPASHLMRPAPGVRRPPPKNDQKLTPLPTPGSSPPYPPSPRHSPPVASRIQTPTSQFFAAQNQNPLPPNSPAFNVAPPSTPYVSNTPQPGFSGMTPQSARFPPPQSNAPYQPALHSAPLRSAPAFPPSHSSPPKPSQLQPSPRVGNIHVLPPSLSRPGSRQNSPTHWQPQPLVAPPPFPPVSAPQLPIYSHPVPTPPPPGSRMQQHLPNSHAGQPLQQQSSRLAQFAASEPYLMQTQTLPSPSPRVVHGQHSPGPPRLGRFHPTGRASPSQIYPPAPLLYSRRSPAPYPLQLRTEFPMRQKSVASTPLLNQRPSPQLRHAMLHPDAGRQFAPVQAPYSAPSSPTGFPRQFGRLSQSSAHVAPGTPGSRPGSRQASPWQSGDKQNGGHSQRSSLRSPIRTQSKQNSGYNTPAHAPALHDPNYFDSLPSDPLHYRRATQPVLRLRPTLPMQSEQPVLRLRPPPSPMHNMQQPLRLRPLRQTPRRRLHRGAVTSDSEDDEPVHYYARPPRRQPNIRASRTRPSSPLHAADYVSDYSDGKEDHSGTSNLANRRRRLAPPPLRTAHPSYTAGPSTAPFGRVYDADSDSELMPRPRRRRVAHSARPMAGAAGYESDHGDGQVKDLGAANVIRVARPLTFPGSGRRILMVPKPPGLKPRSAGGAMSTSASPAPSPPSQSRPSRKTNKTNGGAQPEIAVRRDPKTGRPKLYFLNNAQATAFAGGKPGQAGGGVQIRGIPGKGGQAYPQTLAEYNGMAGVDYDTPKHYLHRVGTYAAEGAATGVGVGATNVMMVAEQARLAALGPAAFKVPAEISTKMFPMKKGHVGWGPFQISGRMGQKVVLKALIEYGLIETIMAVRVGRAKKRIKMGKARPKDFALLESRKGGIHIGNYRFSGRELQKRMLRSLSEYGVVVLIHGLIGMIAPHSLAMGWGLRTLRHIISPF